MKDQDKVQKDQGESPGIPREPEVPPAAPTDWTSPGDEPTPVFGPSPASTEEAPPIKDGFTPFYRKEARFKMAKSFGLYILLVILFVILSGMGLEAFLDKAAYQIEVLGTTVIGLALIGVLWRRISLEAKVGLAAMSLSLVLVEALVIYQATEIHLFNLPSTLMISGYFCLVLAAILLGSWWLWPRFTWPPLLATFLVLYAGLAPVMAILDGGDDFRAILLGPGFMSSWPIFVRAGWWLFQIVLPLGVIVFLILQGRTLLKPQFERQWGYLFWALGLGLAALIGLSGLERAEQPVFPAVASMIERVYPVAMSDRGPTVAKTGPDRATVKPSDRPGLPSPPKAEGEERNRVEPKVEDQPPTPPVIPKAESLKGPEERLSPGNEILKLRERLQTLEGEVEYLKERLEAQDKLIRSLLEYFGTGQEPGPSRRPRSEPPTSSQPKEGEPSQTQPSQEEPAASRHEAI